MEENKINYRFLNYRQYDNFKADLDNGRILDDSIVFIQDRRRIWARGKEFNCNTDVQIEGNTINIVTSDGELVQTEDFVTVDDFNAFLSRYSDQVQESDNVVSLLEQKHDADVNTINNTINRTIATHNDDMRNEINRATTAENNLNDKLDQEIADRTADVNEEETRATNAETNLNNKLDQEIADRQDAVTTENNRATAAENNLNAKLDQEIQDRTTDVNTEETRATNAETVLTNNLNQEISDRQNAVTAENNRAVAVETNLNDKLDQEITDRIADVNAEETRATTAETNLNSKLDDEIANRQTAVTTENNRAVAAENALNSKVNQEIADRQSAVSAEQTRAQGVEQSHAQDIQALQNLIESDHDGVINKFNEITSFLSNIEDTNTLSGIVNGISNQISTVEQTLQNTKQDNISAGEGIDITNNVVSVEDYIGESSINAKLKTLQEYLGTMYVLKKDVYNPDGNNWSEPTIYPFGDLPNSSASDTPNHSDIVAVEQSIYEQLVRDGSIRNDVCYIVYN